MPKFTHETATTTITMHLKPAGQLEASEQFTPVQRLAHASPRPGFVPWAAVGLALVLVFAVLRLRFTWWPIHPVMFLVWGSYQLACFSHSFLLGWMIKAAVTRFGGGRVHRQAVPLMIGVVAGDLLGGLTFMIQGAAYYWIHDVFLPWSNLYHVFPV